MQQFGAHIRHELLQISKKKQGGKKELGTSNIIENFTILNARVHFYCTTTSGSNVLFRKGFAIIYFARLFHITWSSFLINL